MYFLIYPLPELKKNLPLSPARAAAPYSSVIDALIAKSHIDILEGMWIRPLQGCVSKPIACLEKLASALF